jgi:LmeA-like phospholipid-binding
MVTGIIVIVLLALAVGADRLACFAAENDMANQVQQNGFPVKPSVTIEGFPFLTQLAAKDFNEVVISASNVTEGPLTISSIKATLHGMHLIDGYNGARIDTIDGTALVTFTALANAGGIPSGITLGPGASPSQIQATINVPILGNQTVTAQVTKTSPTQFNVRVLNADNIASSLLGNLANFTVNVPKLPAGVDIQSVTITQQGVLITITGHNTTLTEP